MRQRLILISTLLLLASSKAVEHNCKIHCNRSGVFNKWTFHAANCSNIDEIEDLTINECSFEQIDKNVFTKLIKLRYLTLEENTGLHIHDFAAVESLKHITLKKNEHGNIDSKYLNKFRQLVSIKVIEEPITSIQWNLHFEHHITILLKVNHLQSIKIKCTPADIYIKNKDSNVRYKNITYFEIERNRDTVRKSKANALGFNSQFISFLLIYFLSGVIDKFRFI